MIYRKGFPGKISDININCSLADIVRITYIKMKFLGIYFNCIK